jgi:hypothetical protein
MIEEYEKWKANLLLKENSSKKGKLFPFKSIILRMIDDSIPQKEMINYFNDIHKLTVTPAALCRFIKKIRAENIIRIEPEQLLKKQIRKIDSQKKEEEILNISKKEYQTGELPEIDISKFK